MARELILITGGARSGKSALAERLAMQGNRVLFVATAEALDDDMARRIAAHRISRSPEWDTLEEPRSLAEAIRRKTACAGSAYDAIIVDCLTVWVSNLLLLHEGAADAEARILDAAEKFLDVLQPSDARWVVVTNEVGLGVVPPSSLGRAYRDALGRVNSLVASRADKVYLTVAGLALDLKALGARHMNSMDWNDE
jgi:adenosyl cobinamide kinase/adenosyl cobinamide phosphate guanylyltransferase